MKITELQIGDWVTCESKNGKVKELREHKLSLRTENSVMIVYYNSVEPIPITPEILEKNGFVEFMPGNWQIVIDNIMIELREPEHNMAIWLDWDEHDTGTYASYMFPRPDCVHELQHALRLVEVEKEIEL